VTHGLLSLACVPLFWFLLAPCSGEFWFNIIVCALLCVSGNVLIVRALQRSDLSVLGPINAYKSIISLLQGCSCSRNILDARLDWDGVHRFRQLFPGGTEVQEPHRAAFARSFRIEAFSTGCGAGPLCDGGRLSEESAACLISPDDFRLLVGPGTWSLDGRPGLVVGCKQTKQGIRVLKTNWLTFAMLFVTTGLMQLTTILVLEGLQVGYSLALFQTSALLNVALGYTVFQERHFFKRLIGSLIMVAGAVLIIVSR